MWVWPEKILMIVVNVKSNSKKGDLREMDAPFFRISDSRVNMGGSSWGLSEPANPTALKCVRWARLKGISGPKDLTLKSYPQIWQWSVLARISASNDDSRLIPVILDVRFPRHLGEQVATYRRNRRYNPVSLRRGRYRTPIYHHLQEPRDVQSRVGS